MRTRVREVRVGGASKGLESDGSAVGRWRPGGRRDAAADAISRSHCTMPPYSCVRVGVVALQTARCTVVRLCVCRCVRLAGVSPLLLSAASSRLVSSRAWRQVGGRSDLRRKTIRTQNGTDKDRQGQGREDGHAFSPLLVMVSSLCLSLVRSARCTCGPLRAAPGPAPLSSSSHHTSAASLPVSHHPSQWPLPTSRRS